MAERITQRLSPRQRQRLLAAPALQAGLALLRMPLSELLEEIEGEVGRNPFLIYESPAPDGAAASEARAHDSIERIAARPGLIDRLHQQIGLMKLDAQTRRCAELMAGELRDDGYLETPLDQIADYLDLPLHRVQAGLQALQSCEPAGVGARSLSECLALQLQDRGVPHEVSEQVVARLEAFAERDWPALEGALGLPRRELERIAELLPSLAAHPVEPDDAGVSALRPDLIVERAPDGTLRLRTRFDDRATLRLDMALLGRAGADGFARQCRSRAQMLLDALEFRAGTLRRIGAHLLEHQHRFFTGGPEHMRPLSRAQLAAELELHPSTVGRAVADKAMEFEGRLYPLSSFFSRALPQNEGADLSAFVVRRRVAALIAQEDARAPLSDEAIRTALRAEGVDIARRTVAKYRMWMRLPSSRQRLRATRHRRVPSGWTGGAREG